MYRAWYDAREKMPKLDRFAIGIRVEMEILDLLELFVLAQTKRGESRLLILKKADVKIVLLKLFIRLAMENKAISDGVYISLEERVLEIGKMLGGWIKSAHTNSPENRGRS